MAANGFDDDQTRSFTSLVAGTKVLHYSIISKIGAGGMGEVYLAEESQLDRKVALKFLPPHLSQDKDSRARFTREAKAAAKLDHPNIVPIHEVGEFSGRPFFSMAHIEGKSLREVIKERKLSVSDAVEYTKQICEGLHKAHEAGVVHRDIKPANIIIDQDNKPRILDFGLATVTGEEKLTKTGSTLGTVGYMAPEQITGKNVDHRADLFSLGVILYEMLTGRRPFEGDNDAAVVRAITSSSPEPIARFKSGVTGELQLIVDKALFKDASLRYQHADGMLSDLKRLEISQSNTKKSRLSLWAAVAVVVFAGAYLGYTGYFSNEADTQQPERKMLAVLPFENLGGEEDEGFADGITDAITSRIAKISGLGVIARTSVLQYKGTTKRIQEIGTELGVGYILEGTILWDKSGDTDRVRIIPQLIQVSDESHIWTETYARALTGIFEVQADIASSIAEKLDIALLQPEREALQDHPTENMEAYRAYLRAMELSYQDIGGRNIEMREVLLEKAVTLDPGFALAFAELSQVHDFFFHYGDKTDERRERALGAVQEALRLQPDLPEAHFAYGRYYYFTLRDYEKARSELLIAKAGLPNSFKVIAALGVLSKRQGKYEEAIDIYQEGLRLNPVYAPIAIEIAFCYQALRQYEKAMEFFDLTISLRPDNARIYDYKYRLYLDMGDVIGARQVIQNAREYIGEADPWTSYELSLFQRDYETALKWLDSMPKDNLAFSSTWEPTVLKKALTFRYMDERVKALSAFDSSRVWLESKLKEFPEDFRLHETIGITFAGLGDTVKAIAHGQRACELMPTSKDVFIGAKMNLSLAIIYSLLGDADEACIGLEQLLQRPSFYGSVGRLRLDPMWDPLRDHPRFKALIEKYDTASGTD